MRLQKYLSLCGAASRRKSENLIKLGRVKVNNKVITEMGYKINAQDFIKLDDKIIKPQGKAYIVLNKPACIICSHSDLQKRKSVYDIINRNDLKLFTVGRLDYYSNGLIIVTNDGDFSQKVIHPSNNVVKEYYLKSYDNIPEELILNFKSGIYIDNMVYKAEEIHRINKKNVKILLKEGKNREIRTVFKNYNIKIKELTRVSIGNMKLSGLKLKESEFVYLSEEKINKLIFGNQSR